MALTYDSIASSTLTSATSTVTFSSIPSTYNDLRCVIYSPGVSSQASVLMRFNNDANAIYNNIGFGYAANATYTSGTKSSNAVIIPATYGPLADTPFYIGVDINGYTLTNSYYVTTLQEFSSPNITTSNQRFERACSNYQSSGIISRIDFILSGANFNIGSTFSLYGITAA